jgi:hypothetical protein
VILPRLLPSPNRCQIINFFKGATLPVMLLLMYHFQGGFTAAVYVGLHGAYGIVWVMKDLLFPDKTWQDHITIPAGLFLASGLTMYWAGGYFCMQNGEASPALVLAAVLLWGVGACVMIATDCQKHFTLKARPGLITDGMFLLCRWVSVGGGGPRRCGGEGGVAGEQAALQVGTSIRLWPPGPQTT